MRQRFVTLTLALASTIAVVSLTPARIAGQAPRGAARPYAPPRTPDGHPDLQGTYDLATLTPLQRPSGQPLTMTSEQAKQLESQVADRSAKADAPVDANRAAPPKGGDGSPGPYGNVGGYNNFWLDPGSHYTSVDGSKRASLLIDPPDGRVPPLTEAARTRNASRVLRTTSDQAIREDDPGFEGADAYDDPEQ